MINLKHATMGLALLAMGVSALKPVDAAEYAGFSEPLPPTTAPTSQPGGTENEAPVRLLASDKEGLNANLRRRAIVTGVVARAELAKSGKVIRISFMKTTASGFQSVVFERNIRAFEKHLGGELGPTLEGKTVEITGVIQDFAGKPQIIMADPSQIEIKK